MRKSNYYFFGAAVVLMLAGVILMISAASGYSQGNGFDVVKALIGAAMTVPFVAVMNGGGYDV